MSKELVKQTITHFKDYYSNLSEDDAKDIINNFICFAHLLIKLDKKQTKALKQERTNNYE